MKKKLNKKALLGVGAGLLAAAVGACCLFGKKKNDDEEYVVEDECFDEEAEEVEE